MLRTLTLGHLFTQGTADSNEVWLEVTVTSGDRILGLSGGRRPTDGAVDPWSHFVNAYVLDRDGNRIDRRNAEDIFTPLYNHQIPPGSASVAHYRLKLPDDLDAPVEVAAKLHYRKFDTIYTRLFQGDAFERNDLPIVTIAEDRVVFPVSPRADAVAPRHTAVAAAGTTTGSGSSPSPTAARSDRPRRRSPRSRPWAAPTAI